MCVCVCWAGYQGNSWLNVDLVPCGYLTYVYRVIYLYNYWLTISCAVEWMLPACMVSSSNLMSMRQPGQKPQRGRLRAWIQGVLRKCPIFGESPR